MDLSGIAAIITAVTGSMSVLLTVWVVLRVGHVVSLTNSNFSALQATLDTALKENVRQQETAANVAKDAQQLAREVVSAAVGPHPPASSEPQPVTIVADEPVPVVVSGPKPDGG